MSIDPSSHSLTASTAASAAASSSKMLRITCWSAIPPPHEHSFEPEYLAAAAPFPRRRTAATASRYAPRMATTDPATGLPPPEPLVTSAAHEPVPGALERMGLTALGYPAFATFFTANLTANASWFIFGAALNTYILAVTGSAQTVGIASFLYSLPFALFMLHAGLLADRFGSKLLVVVSLVGAGSAIVATGLLGLAGWPLPVLIALGCVMSTFQ